jgi:adhesin/invasin
MVTQRSIGIVLLSLLVLPLALIGACDKVPLLAPTGSVITLLPTTNTVSLNSEVDIIATVIENGVAVGGTGPTVSTRSGGGTAVQNGTLVTFTTTLGRIEPSEARTHNGQVTVKFITDGSSGTATITAYSGGASASKDLAIGTAAVPTGGISVTSTPQSLGAAGGSAQVSATVTDAGGNPLRGIPVTFSTDKGSMSPSTATSDASGVATSTLTTNATSVVTARAGVATGTATVTVNARGLSSFVADPQATTTGTPVKFTVTPTTGVNLSNVVIDFGDGRSQPLGSITSASSTTHVYNTPGNYTARATSFDTTGEAGSLTTNVIVGSLPVTLTPSPTTPTVNAPVTFTVGGVTGAQVDHYTWVFSDGTTDTTTAPQDAHTFTSRGVKTIRVDVFGVGGGLIGSATTSIDVQ